MQIAFIAKINSKHFNFFNFVPYSKCYCVSDGIEIEVAHTSGLLDTSVPAYEKLYGYHRLEDPLVVTTDEKGILIAKKRSQLQQFKREQEPVLADRNDTLLKKNKVGEPNKW